MVVGRGKTDGSCNRDESHRTSSDVKNRLTVDGRQGRTRTGIVALLDISALRGLPVGSRALIARDLGRNRFTSRELKEVARIGWMTEVAVEPPLVECIVDQRSDGPVVVREGVFGDVESVHARMPNRCENLRKQFAGGKGKRVTGMGVHVGSGEGKERNERESEHGAGDRGSSRKGK